MLDTNLLFKPTFLSSSAPSQPGSPRDFALLLGHQYLISHFRARSSESHRSSILRHCMPQTCRTLSLTGSLSTARITGELGGPQ
jgi:hypothetical protein